MKKYLLLLSIVMVSLSSGAQDDTLLSGFNSSIYPTVLTAAKAVGMPFLLQQGYLSMQGVSIADSSIIYGGISYHVRQEYLNPASGYYVSTSQYSSYDISGFSRIWPGQFPNILFQAGDTSFNELSDCVGYLTRLLSATGDTSAYGNAYLNIINTTHAANTVPFAHTGYVATAYSFAVAFPTLPVSVSLGWQYIAGNVEADTINSYNHTIVGSLGTYNGVRKGGFAASQPGDILAFGYSASSFSNGHVMVMETSPHLLTADSLALFFPSQTIAQAAALLGTHNIYSVSVFDCSGQEAHFRDSRINVSGIGHGRLLIITDTADDAPTGFIFDSSQVIHTSLHMDTLGPTVFAISVGRFVTATINSGIADIGRSGPALNVFPNPTNDQLHIELPAETAGQVTIYTIDGHMIYEQMAASSSLTMEVGRWPEGVYLIRYMPLSGNSLYAKWIKQ